MTEQKPPITFRQISQPAHRQITVSLLLAVLAAVLSLVPVIVLVELVRSVMLSFQGEPIDASKLWLLVAALMVATVLHGQATVKSLQVSHQADGLLGEHLSLIHI